MDGESVAGAGAGIGAIGWIIAGGAAVTVALTGPVNSAGGVFSASLEGAFTGTPRVAIGCTGCAGADEIGAGCCRAAADGAATGTGFEGTAVSVAAATGAGVDTGSETAASSDGIGTAGIPTTGTCTAAGLIEVVTGTCNIGGAATSAAGAIGAGTAGMVAGAAWAGAAVAAGISLVIDAF